MRRVSDRLAPFILKGSKSNSKNSIIEKMFRNYRSADFRAPLKMYLCFLGNVSREYIFEEREHEATRIF